MQLKSLNLILHHSLQEYSLTHALMKQSVNRPHHEDCCWILQHKPIITIGPRTPQKDYINSRIPIVRTDRGGLATYHGPGQWIVYFMIDLTQQSMNIIDMVGEIEQFIIEVLREINIDAYAKKEDRGVYVSHRKIASVGLRARNNISYHGLAINTNMDLSPFSDIYPCGKKRLMTQIKDEQPQFDCHQLPDILIKHIHNLLMY